MTPTSLIKKSPKTPHLGPCGWLSQPNIFPFSKSIFAKGKMFWYWKIKESKLGIHSGLEHTFVFLFVTLFPLISGRYFRVFVIAGSIWKAKKNWRVKKILIISYLAYLYIDGELTGGNVSPPPYKGIYPYFSGRECCPYYKTGGHHVKKCCFP